MRTSCIHAIGYPQTDYMQASASMPYASIGPTVALKNITRIILSGYTTPGDLGAGMPMIVGASTGPLAKQSADGRWWNLDVASLADIPVGYCGAVADDSTDNTEAFRNCASIANAASKLLRVRTRGGIMRAGATGTINVATGVIGDGKTLSYLRNMAGTSNLFYFIGNTPRFVGIHYLPSASAPTGGAAIYIDAKEGSYTYNPEVSENAFQGQWDDVNCSRCAHPDIHNNFSTAVQHASLTIDNLDKPDLGDGTIYANSIDMGASPSTAEGILQLGGGGLKGWGNKIFGGAHCYHLNLDYAAVTSDLQFFHNSCEGQVGGAPIKIEQQSPMPGQAAGGFGNAEISDNQISLYSASYPAIDIHGKNDAGKVWLSDVTVGAGQIQVPAGGMGISIAGGQDMTILTTAMQMPNGPATALNIAEGVTGTVSAPTNITGPAIICVCNSSTVAYRDFVVSRPTSGPGGKTSIPIFEFDMAANTGLSVELTAAGIIQNWVGSIGRATLDAFSYGNGISRQFSNVATLPAVGADSSGNVGFGFTTSASGLNLTINQTYNAVSGSPGSTPNSTVRVNAFVGTIKTL